MHGGKTKTKANKPTREILSNPLLNETEKVLANKLETRVFVELGQQKGKITIEFADNQDLERISQIILS